jgi:hypothetical protein
MPQQWVENWLLADGSKGMTFAERYIEYDNPSQKAQISEKRDSAVQRLGNLTLLTQPLNSSVSNNTWEIKRAEIAKHSALALNRMPATVQKWDELAIDYRAKELLSIALKLWLGPTPQAATTVSAIG